MLKFNTRAMTQYRLFSHERVFKATPPLPKVLKTGLLATLLCCVFSQTIYGQCSPDITPPTALCVGPFTIALDGTGQAGIDPDDIDNGSFDNCGAVTLSVAPNQVTCADIGLVTVTLTVTDNATNTNTCTTVVTVEDNLPPAPSCPADITVECDVFNQMDPSTSGGTPTASDNCDLTPTISAYTDVNASYTAINCRTIERTWEFEDAEGNISTCTQEITVEDNEAPTITGTIPTVMPLECGDPTSVPMPMLTPGDNCNFNFMFNPINAQDPDPSMCGHYTYTYIRNWDIIDSCGNFFSRSQVIEVEDTEVPTFTGAPTSITVSASATCTTSVTLDISSFVDDCADDIYLTTTYEVYLNGNPTPLEQGNGLDASGDFLPGMYTILYEATDPCGNTGFHAIALEVEDVIPPTAICSSSTIQVSIPPTGTTSVSVAQVNNGSFDNCTPAGDLTFSLTGGTFDCGDVGGFFPNIVELTVEDANGNTNTCTVGVNVVNNSPPAVLCQSLTVTLDASGIRTVDSDEHDNGSFDDCDANGSLQFRYVEVDGVPIAPTFDYDFDCSHVGAPIPVRVRVREVDNNQLPPYVNDGFCNTTVTVVDDTAPVADCDDITVYLDQSGMWTLTPADSAALVNASSDACDFTASFSQTMFTCNDMDDGNPSNGPEREIEIIITDPSNNADTCTAIVTVLDTIRPMITCADTVSLCLDADGIGKIYPDSLINGGIYISSGDNGSGNSGTTQFCVQVSNLTTLSFDWDYQSNNSNAGWDPFGYSVNGGFTQLTAGASCSFSGSTTQSGSATVTLSAGDIFCFEAQTCDNTFGNAETWIKNLSETLSGDFAQSNWTTSLTNSDGKAFFVDATIACGPINYQIALDSVTWQDCDSLFCDSVGAYVNAWVRAIDENGNISDTCEVRLHVEDKEPPTASCQSVTKALNGGGTAVVNADEFDNGSTDACSLPLSFMVSIDGGLNFFSTLNLDCDDIVDNQEAIVKVSDAASPPNDAFCVTTLTIQDNLGPVISCPADITVNCDDSLDPNDTGLATALDNCDGPVTPTYTDQNIPISYTSDDCRVIRRTWRAEDSEGNITVCFQDITVEDNEAPELDWNGATAGLGMPPANTTEDACTVPAAAVPVLSDNCNDPNDITYSFTEFDSRFDGISPPNPTTSDCGYYNYTLTRTWSATDSCSNNTTHVQVVTVEDVTDPTLSFPAMFMFVNNPGQCAGTVTIDLLAHIMDDCAPDAVLDVEFSIDGGPTQTGTSVNTVLNVGTHSIEVTATDPCGNNDTQTFDVVVKDNETPTAICAFGPIPITLNSNGVATISPSTINNGSSDNCAVASLNISPALFDCNTSPNPHPVVLTVTDVAGNSNTCTTFVQITNVSTPAIICPGDVTVDCDVFDANDPSTSGGSATATTACGTVTTTYADVTISGLANCRVIERTWTATTAGGSATCVQTITVEDNDDPVLSAAPVDVTVDCYTIPTAATLTATDNCDANPAISFVETDNQDPDPNSCDHYTYEILREWEATDDCGNTDSDSQTIFVVDDDDPVVNIPDPLIIGTDADECFATVSENLLDYVTDCADDMFLTITNTALADYATGNGTDNINGVYVPGDYPIEFTVIDPCGNDITVNFVLSIRDMEAPQAVCSPAETLILDGSGNGSLLPADIDDGSIDNCGITSMSLNPSTFTTSNVGVVNVELTVEDAAGNTSMCTTPVTVIERGTVSAGNVQGASGTSVSIPVTVTGFDDICAVSFSIHVDPTVATVTGVSGLNLPGLMMSDFFPNSPFTNDISFSWVNGSPVTLSDGTAIFNIDVDISGSPGDMSSVVLDGTPVAVLMARCDLSTIPVSTVDGSVTIVTSPANVLLDGTIATELGAPVGLVDVAMTGSVGGTQSTAAGVGTYGFTVPMGSNETITPTKDINDCNGINVLDVLLLQLHILGDPANQLPTPYRRIAADINGDGSINVLDRLELQLIVLAGSPTTCIGLASNSSWRFVPSAYVFPNPLDPFTPAFPESISYTNVMTSQTGDFVGIKIGDLETTVTPADPANFGGGGVSSGNGELNFAIDNQQVSAGSEYRIEFKAKDFVDYQAYQYTLDFDESVLQFKHFEAGALPSLTAQNFSLNHVDQGTMTSIWYHDQAVTLNNDEVLFTLVFDAIAEGGDLSELIEVIADPVANEAYTSDFSKSDIGLNFNSLTGIDELENGSFTLYQNHPNPFGDETWIPFYVSEATHATLTVTDVSGKTVKVMEGDFSSGNHSFILSRQDLNSAGVYFYRLDTKQGIAVKKMVLLD